MLSPSARLRTSLSKRDGVGWEGPTPFDKLRMWSFLKCVFEKVKKVMLSPSARLRTSLSKRDGVGWEGTTPFDKLRMWSFLMGMFVKEEKSC